MGSRQILLVAALAVCLAPACRQRAVKPDAGHGPITAEQRFGNDPELVADFNNLEACAYADGRLDFSCPAVTELRTRMSTRQRRAKMREKLVTTLANLLESTRPRTRLMAAASLQPHLKHPDIRKAVGAAWVGEDVPAIQATMLRMLCLAPGGGGPATAAAALGGKAELPVQVRAEATTCLGKAKAPASEHITRLRKLLSGKEKPAVRGAACEALGMLGAAAAVKELAAGLGEPKIAHRCATALAAIGDDQAYAALRDATRAKLGRGRVPAQQVRALASFEGKGEELKQLLEAVAADAAVGASAQDAARQALAR